MITNQIEEAMSKLLRETGLDANCITLHPEHHAQLIREFDASRDLQEPIHYNGIPVYKAELIDDFGATNPCLEEGYSIVGHYDFGLDQYLSEQHIALVSQ